MNRRSILAFLLVGAAAVLHVHAQDKATPSKTTTPKADKAEKSTDKPKVLIFPPNGKVPEGGAEPGAARAEPVQRATVANPLLDGPSRMVAEFFASVREGKIDDGYAVFTKDSKIAEKPEELKLLKAKTREAVEVFGTITGYDFVESRAIGQRLVRATYVSQGKVFPLRWRFYFYKPENFWRLIDLRVDDKLTGIFDEAEETKPEDLKTGPAGLP